jgi:Translationally controlled tumour protein
MQEAGKSEEEVKQFEDGAKAFFKKVNSNFKDYDFYVGESMDINGMYALVPPHFQYL